MVRNDDGMFKIHPKDMCRDDPAVTEMRSRGYWVKDPEPSRVGDSLPDDFVHPDTNSGIGLVFPAAHVNSSGLDAKLDRIIELLIDIKGMLK